MPYTHKYHAEASALEGHLRLPIRQPIEPQAYAKVPEAGGYLSQHAESYRAEGIVSYGAAHTQVSGHLENEKPGGGFKSLATSVVEDLNVLNVVTADRMVAQVSTEHPLEGYVPTVTFLGTQFYNLRIAGFDVAVELDLDLLDEPTGEQAYTRHPGFLKRMAERLEIFRKENSEVPAHIRNRYTSERSEADDGESCEYSLVKSIRIEGPGKFPGKVYGHVIDVPHFGRIYLAVVRIEHTDPNTGGREFHKQTLIDLTMLNIDMGCIAAGQMMIASGKTNGGSTPVTG